MRAMARMLTVSLTAVFLQAACEKAAEEDRAFRLVEVNAKAFERLAVGGGTIEGEAGGTITVGFVRCLDPDGGGYNCGHFTLEDFTQDGQLVLNGELTFNGSFHPAPLKGDLVISVSAGGPTVAEKAKSATTDQTAATITSTTGSPKRVPGSYRWSVESAAESPGLEAALRRDLRGLLTAAIDQMVVDDLVAIETATDMSSQLTFALLKGLIAGEVDGQYAVDEMAVRLLCNATVFARLMAVNPTNDDSVDGAAWMRMHSGGVRVSDKMPAANSGISDSVFVRTSVRSTSMVSVWADAQAVLDPYTRASQGERVLTVFSLVDHSVIDAGAYSVQGIKTTS